MDVRLSTPQEYFQAFPSPVTVFSSQAFVAANAARAQAVRFFIGRDLKGRPRMGIILGLNDGEWRCPFSAPFGEVACRPAEQLERIYDFVSELADMLQGMPLRITLPPAFYAPEPITRLAAVLGNYASKSWIDYNYHYDLARAPRFEQSMAANARKNYRAALRAGFQFAETDDIPRAYAVIQANRQAKGYPLAMSLEQVLATAKTPGAEGQQPVTARFFILSTAGGEDAAAAMVYDTAPGIGQVVYWGDAPGHSAQRPMNLLPVKIFQHYHQLGYRILDIGPSSSQGVPSPGLCQYKESLGCELSPKPTFVINA